MQEMAHRWARADYRRSMYGLISTIPLIALAYIGTATIKDPHVASGSHRVIAFLGLTLVALPVFIGIAWDIRKIRALRKEQGLEGLGL